MDPSSIESSLLFSFVPANKADILDRLLAYFLAIGKKLEQSFLEPKQIGGCPIKYDYPQVCR